MESKAFLISSWVSVKAEWNQQELCFKISCLWVKSILASFQHPSFGHLAEAASHRKSLDTLQILHLLLRHQQMLVWSWSQIALRQNHLGMVLSSVPWKFCLEAVNSATIEAYVSAVVFQLLTMPLGLSDGSRQHEVDSSVWNKDWHGTNHLDLNMQQHWLESGNWARSISSFIICVTLQKWSVLMKMISLFFQTANHHHQAHFACYGNHTTIRKHWRNKWFIINT